MEIALSYRDIEKIVAKKFNINLALNPYPLWYSENVKEFVVLSKNISENIILKIRVDSDLI